MQLNFLSPEEALFKREIKFEDQVLVDLVVTKATHDFSRWSIRHHIYIRDRQIAAIINMDGAWIELTKRKLARPNDFIQSVFFDFPKADAFEWIQAKSLTSQ